MSTSAQVSNVHGVQLLELPTKGPPLRDAADLISLAWEHDVALIAIPVERLEASFFKLASGEAGEFAQKCVNYRLRLVIVGDISVHVASSRALQSFVYESNRGTHLWFVENREALTARLAGRS
ncbi:DUF4180 domain-containing protein [Hyalangium versicolor]|uniref:DUF4180 domain-containing protein n=1 Tax=Hyalangium versicolor TaxID=2861190 RepID=UPI001CCA7C95|nr:DUF4180 domain-containing protein [Hyalangium versicolor]